MTGLIDFGWGGGAANGECELGGAPVNDCLTMHE